MRTTTALQAKALYLALRAGPVGWAGLAAILLALAVVLVSRLDLDASNRAAREELVQLQARLDRASAPGAALRNPADPIAAVTSQLPAADRAPVFIQDVQGRAARGGVQIDRTEYRIQSALAGRALRLQLLMPAHGTYPQLRTWLESLLHEYPSAALEELSLRRDGDGAPALQARVAISYYTQAVQ